MNPMHEEWKAAEVAAIAESLPAQRRGLADGAAEKARIDAVAQTEAIRRRTVNAGKAVEWLDGIGIKILNVEITRHAAIVRIAYTPFLNKLFANECAWRQQRQEGNARILTWFALRYGARIEWEEIQCSRN